MTMEMKQHPLSAAFPAMPEDEFRQLVEDIRRHGQRDPILIYEEQVLDGWHRYSACAELGIEPKKLNWSGEDPVAFVESVNLHRRHLSASQRAMAVVALAEWAPASIKKSAQQARGAAAAPQTNAEMAKAAKVSERTIKDAKAAHRAGLTEPVKQGAMTVEEAAKVARGKVEPETEAPKSATNREVPEHDPEDDFDPVAELESAHAEITKLTGEIQAAEADDLKGEAIKWRRSYEHAQRQQSEAMDRAKKATDREAWTMRQLRRCGKAIGQDDPAKIAPSVEAFVRQHRKEAA